MRIHLKHKSKAGETFYLLEEEDSPYFGEVGSIYVENLGNRLCTISPLDFFGQDYIPKPKDAVKVIQSLMKQSPIVKSSRYVLAVLAEGQDYYPIHTTLTDAGFKQVATVLNRRSSNDLYVYLKRKRPWLKNKAMKNKLYYEFAECCGACAVYSKSSAIGAMRNGYSLILYVGPFNKFLRELSFIRIAKHIWIKPHHGDGYGYKSEDTIIQYPSNKEIKITHEAYVDPDEEPHDECYT